MVLKICTVIKAIQRPADFSGINMKLTFNCVCLQPPVEAIQTFQEVASTRDDPEELVDIFLLGSILNRTEAEESVLPRDVN